MGWGWARARELLHAFLSLSLCHTLTHTRTRSCAPLPRTSPASLQGEVAFLLATELAARGLDILGVETVVNYDAPAQLSSYLHRCARQGWDGRRRACRAGGLAGMSCDGGGTAAGRGKAGGHQLPHGACHMAAVAGAWCVRPRACAGLACVCLVCRVGRTARAGAQGRAVTFIEDDDRPLLKEVRLGRHGVAAWPAEYVCLRGLHLHSWPHRPHRPHRLMA